MRCKYCGTALVNNDDATEHAALCEPCAFICPVCEYDDPDIEQNLLDGIEETFLKCPKCSQEWARTFRELPY